MLLKNRYEELDRLATGLQRFGRQSGLNSGLIHDLMVSADEIVTNAIAYSWKDQAEHSLEVHVEKKHNSVVLVFSYDGLAFNPFSQAPKADCTSKLKDRHPGGLGVWIVKSLMTHTAYSRQGDLNIITLEKTINA